jgi:hypothetical protein
MGASAQVTAHAIAEARVNVLITQINYIVRETTGSMAIEQVLEKGILQNKWIAAVRVRAVDQHEKIWTEIGVQVDWERHRINIRRDGETVLIDKALPVGQQVSWAIGEMVRFFKNYTKKGQLRAIWTIDYVSEIENDTDARDRTTAALNLIYGPARSWVNGEIVDVLVETPERLDEATFRLRAAT